MDSSTIAIVITVITIVSFILEKIPLAMTAMIASLAMGILVPEMKLSDIYSGFASNNVIMVAGMCIVGDALFKTGMANKIGKALGKSAVAKNERTFLVAVVICCTVMSAFLSNSGTIAMWMPLIAAVAAKSNGVIRSKMVIMAAGIASAIGGAGTLVGSTSQQTANAVLMGVAGYEDGLSLFDQTKIMIPLCLIMIIYFATVGYSLTKKVLKPESPDFDKGNYYADLASKTSDETQNDVPAWKGWFSLIVLLLCIVGFILTDQAAFKPYINVAVVALIGATVLITSGCMPLKKTLAEMDWNTLVILAAAQGFAKGLDVSGGGRVIADAVLNLFGGQEASTTVLMVAGIIVTAVLTNFMSNTALAAMMTPIYIQIANSLGISPVPFVIAIGCVATNLACATPVGTPACTQTLPAGYKYMDYMKIGGPLLILLIIGAVFFAPIMYPF
ncbi:SLC13 family permease [Intestinimonas butyriciproducens]|uniref:Anion transporter n=1 Tax=Intestinimonas butyriciproducens TaxID=1297617 RepID=A0A2U1BI62_9FIRM|nr:SLC13 family permease [Intestinimonas butyriciproducens]MCI6363429.1 anion permease [Intestinimonas butyriciproducens]MCR1906553.1 SLC13 family permease [Intestinimonas butyriciproducens]MDY3616646.1 SLC13 family permease [Intestinimonas butyriciproducens]PVY48369.1 anion transporter [Intestinimonas butyriciproducens]QBB67244.1 Anion permease ArsB/NhaD-like [Intestinimonas butyriciproducens]